MQVLGGVPAELRLTPERDERLEAQAQALGRQDVVRLLDLLSVGLDAVANGAQARIQLELALVKAAAPEVDPSARALLARIDRLEARLAEGAVAAPPPAKLAPPPAATPAAAPQPPAPAPQPPAPTPPAPAPEASAPTPPAPTPPAAAPEAAAAQPPAPQPPAPTPPAPRA